MSVPTSSSNGPAFPLPSAAFVAMREALKYAKMVALTYRVDPGVIQSIDAALALAEKELPNA